MSITSLHFLAFTAATLVVYYLLPHKGQNMLLMIASYAFLVSWDVQFALVFLCLTLVNFYLANFAAKTGKSGKDALIGGIFINILALAFFKYADFFTPGLLALIELFGFKSQASSVGVLLPIGLSFFVVQVISYLVDVNNGNAKPAGNLIDFAVYMAYFPRVVSGPIERSRSFLSTLQQKRTFTRKNLAENAVLVIQGLVRKIVIADLLLYIMPYNVFTEPKLFSPLELGVWLVAFSFAIYNDFAGYTSIARGISGLFGIPLVKNFNTPYLSRTFSEFWQRWHMSLSHWLRDYIYYPIAWYLVKLPSLSGKILSIIIAPIITMLISALWHNASNNMLLWGGLYSIYLIIERLITIKFPNKKRSKTLSMKQLPAILIVFLLVSLAWVPFRTDVASTLAYWIGLFSPVSWVDMIRNFGDVRHAIINRFGIDVFLLVGFSVILDLAHDRFGELAVLRLPEPLVALVLNVVIFALIIATMAMSVPPPFIYQGF